MRDLERLREKHEFVLDDRQIAAVAVCALILLAGAFALGLMLGLHSAPQPAQQPDLAAMDAEAKKPAPPAPAPAPKAVVAKAEPPEEEAPEQGKPPASIPATPPAAQPPPAARAAMVVPPPPRPITVASPVQVELAPPPKDVGNFTVQVGASQDKSEARKLQQRALAAGLKPYVVEADLGAKGTWYRVRVGAFPDKDAATRFKKDVERELRANAVVMATK